jgi:hypothetical protein
LTWVLFVGEDIALRKPDNRSIVYLHLNFKVLIQKIKERHFIDIVINTLPMTCEKENGSKEIYENCIHDGIGSECDLY